MLIELNIIGDVYGNPNKETGEPKLIRKNVVYKRIFDTISIKAEEYIDHKGNVLKNWVNIIEGETTYKAKHKYSDIVTKLQPIIVKGFGGYYGKRKSSIKN